MNPGFVGTHSLPQAKAYQITSTNLQSTGRGPDTSERPSGLSFIGFLVNLLMSSVLIIPGMRAALRNSDHLGEQVGVKVAVGPMIIHQSNKSSFLWWGFNSMQDQDKKKSVGLMSHHTG